MRGLLLVSLFFLTGCFKYVPLETPASELERGAELRTYFIDEQSVDLYDVTAHNIISMDVEFVRQEVSEYVFSAFYLDSAAREAGYLGNGWTVRVPVQSVSYIEVRKLDLFRTVGLGLLAVVGSLAGWEIFGGGLGGDGGPGNDGGEIF